MDRLIVYVDDATHGLSVLQPMLAAPAAGQAPRQWILVACPPRVTHHVSKWVTHSARESWRAKWADKLFDRLVPALQQQGAPEVITCCGKNNLVAQADSLQRIHGAARVIDARRPKLPPGPVSMPAPAARPTGPGGLLGAWLTLTGSGMLLALD